MTSECWLQLVSSLQHGAVAAQEAAARDIVKWFREVARGHSLPRSVAEDCAQATFKTMFTMLREGKLVGGAELRAYWQRAVRNWVFKWQRNRSVSARHMRLFAEKDRQRRQGTCVLSPDERQQREAAALALVRLLRKLEPRYQQVLVLRFVDGRTQEETAEFLQVPVGNISRWETQGIQQLRWRMRGEAL